MNTIYLCAGALIVLALYDLCEATDKLHRRITSTEATKDGQAAESVVNPGY